MRKDRIVAFIISIIVAVLFGIIVKSINKNNLNNKNIVLANNKIVNNDVKKIPTNNKSNEATKSQNVADLQQLKKEDNNNEKKEQEMYVLVASEDIKQGDMIKTEKLKWDLWPKKNISDSYVSKDDKGHYTHPSLTMESLIGLNTKINIPKNSPITKSFLLEGEVDKSNYAIEISPGKRAISVPVDQMSVKNSVFAPNDFVDVYFCNRTKVIRNVRILALDDFTNKDNVEDSPDKKNNIFTKLPQTVTLELSPIKVDYLMKNMKGSVFLAMVSNEETDDIKDSDDSSEYEQDDAEFEDKKADENSTEKNSDQKDHENSTKEHDDKKENEKDQGSDNKQEKENSEAEKNVQDKNAQQQQKNQQQEEEDEQPQEKTLENDPEDLILIIRKDKAQLFDTSRIGLNQQQQQQEGDDDDQQ